MEEIIDKEMNDFINDLQSDAEIMLKNYKDPLDDLLSEIEKVDDIYSDIVLDNTEPVFEKKILEPEIMIKLLSFDEYFKDCSNVTQLKKCRKNIIKSLDEIFSAGFGRNDRTDQLSQLMENYNDGDIALLETTFIENLDIEYKSRLHTFDKTKKRSIETPTSKNKKKRKIENEN